MRIEELSIGDWVCAKLAKWESDDADTTPPLQVKCIDGIERHNLYVDLFNPTTNTIEHSAFVEDLVPIPLTPEILEKIGFVRWERGSNKGDYYLDSPRNKRLWLFYDFDTYHVSYIINTGGCEILFRCRDITSVHQLQHALRLAGIEKEIEL